MKKHILLLGVLCFQYATTTAFGQQNSSIAQWISAHPSVHIFSEKNYERLDEEFKTKLKGKVVVYQDQLTLDLLNAYDPLEKTDEVSTGTYTKEDPDASVIKEWLGLHPGIKILKQSEFQALTEERQELYQSIEALILIGETITIQDIQNYPH